MSAAGAAPPRLPRGHPREGGPRGRARRRGPAALRTECLQRPAGERTRSHFGDTKPQPNTTPPFSSPASQLGDPPPQSQTIAPLSLGAPPPHPPALSALLPKRALGSHPFPAQSFHGAQGGGQTPTSTDSQLPSSRLSPPPSAHKERRHTGNPKQAGSSNGVLRAISFMLRASEGPPVVFNGLIKGSPNCARFQLFLFSSE